MQNDNIVLVGMPGSGKTTIGKLLAERCGLTFIDLDESILKRRGFQNVADIFAQEDGETLFRNMESEMLKEIAADANHIVLATGGGSCLRPMNRQHMKEIGHVVWLDASVDVLLGRLRENWTTERPLLQHSSEAELRRILRDMTSKRKASYASASQYHADVDELSVDKLVRKIIGELDLTVHESVFDTVLAIDGPVASGKSSVAREVANALSWIHVNTGAMYRCVTLLAKELNKLENCKAEELTAMAVSLDFSFGPKNANGERPVLLRGNDVTDQINTQEISRNVSKVADTLGVRSALVDVQRQMAKKGNAVLEGRDISTVVCPEARWKFFLVASLEERAKRRAAEYTSRGEEVDMLVLNCDILQRDNRDRMRPQGGLKLHPDAIIFDSTDIPMDEVVNTIASIASRTVVDRKTAQ